MAKKRKKAESKSTRVASNSEPDRAADGPSPWIRRVVIGLACLHLCLIWLSFSQPIALSETLSSVLEWGQPYLRATHFGLDDESAGLPAGSIDEAELRLQYAETDTLEEADWSEVPWDPDNVRSLQRKQRFLAAAVSLAEGEQYGLVALWLSSVLSNLPEAKLIRIVRIPTLLSDAAEDSQPPPYRARVLRSRGKIRLAHFQEPRLVAIAGDEDEQPSTKRARASESTTVRADKTEETGVSAPSVQKSEPVP